MTEPYYQDKFWTLYKSDCRNMSELPNEFVQMVCCSPPYWGLRKYSGNQDLIWGGDEKCVHHFDIPTLAIQGNNSMVRGAGEIDSGNFAIPKFKGTGMRQQKVIAGNFCSLCGAWKGAYGLEPTPEMYVTHTIEILREIRRVLRKDGVVFWNIGDSYAQGGGETYRGSKRWQHLGGRIEEDKHWDKSAQSYNLKACNLKPKDLCLIPFRVAIAAQEDGWWVRSVIIWSKPNPMPESVTDRPTESHEYILMLTKSARYYWDAEAVREPHSEWSQKLQEYQKQGSYHFSSPKHKNTVGGAQWIANVDLALNPAGRNLRSVWTINTQPFKGAHFATYPEKLVEICIKAATPEVGCCSKCGAPWVRIVKRDVNFVPRTGEKYEGGSSFMSRLSTTRSTVEVETLGWKPTCDCHAEAMPSIVLDPFAGSGTTLVVAKKLGRHAIGYEISEPYCKLAVERNKQMVML